MKSSQSSCSIVNSASNKPEVMADAQITPYELIPGKQQSPTEVSDKWDFICSALPSPSHSQDS